MLLESISNQIIVILLGTTLLCLILIIAGFFWAHHSRSLHLNEMKEGLIDRMANLSQTLDRRMSDNIIQYSKDAAENRLLLTQTLARNSDELSLRLRDISLQVEKRLSEGFDKTTATFTDIVKRLALIDDAQKKLTELSSNVVSLQEILVDKRSRGAFGEVQLKNLVQNMLPPDNYNFQHTLSTGVRADCILFLPAPTGNLVIDSKFPLENYQLMTNVSLTEPERKKAQQQFRQDIKKHIGDIQSKYIIQGETSDGAMMFIPAEAVFAEIHAHYPDLVEQSHRACVWLASPTTMMAILTTARAVLKDNATRKHIHVIQEHLRRLAEDFSRFESRMNQLAKHIDQAQQDVQHVHTSAAKITSRFRKIEATDLGNSQIDGEMTPERLEQAESLEPAENE